MLRSQNQILLRRSRRFHEHHLAVRRCAAGCRRVLSGEFRVGGISLRASVRSWPGGGNTSWTPGLTTCRHGWPCSRHDTHDTHDASSVLLLRCSEAKALATEGRVGGEPARRARLHAPASRGGNDPLRKLQAELEAVRRWEHQARVPQTASGLCFPRTYPVSDVMPMSATGAADATEESACQENRSGRARQKSVEGVASFLLEP